MSWRVRKFLLVISVVLIAGGVAVFRPREPRLHPVRGCLLYRGVPATGAVVVLHPTHGDPLRARRPNARVGADGLFSLDTGPRAGAAEGEYVITVFWPQPPPPPNPRDPLSRFKRAIEASPDRLHGQYASQTVSKLSVCVVGPTDIPLIDLP
jgi:hypothetical protein